MKNPTKADLREIEVRFKALLLREAINLGLVLVKDYSLTEIQDQIKTRGGTWKLSDFSDKLGYNIGDFYYWWAFEEMMLRLTPEGGEPDQPNQPYNPEEEQQEMATTTRKKQDQPNPGTSDQVQQIAALLAGLTSSTVSDDHIIKLIKKHSQTPISVEVKASDKVKVIEKAHSRLPDLINVLSTGNHCYLVGPAGSGKTTLAEQAAEALSLDFYQTGAVLQKYELVGYTDANSHYHETSLYSAYTKGGLFLFDEMDSSSAAALVAFNALLANPSYTFPNSDKPVARHKDFVCVAAANTIGTGPTREYVGRQPLDAATLDRFIQLEIGYDEELELRLAQEHYKANGGSCLTTPVNWVEDVQALREKAAKSKIHVVISPRASMQGAALLAKGIHIKDVKQMVLYKHLNEDQRQKLA